MSEREKDPFEVDADRVRRPHVEQTNISLKSSDPFELPGELVQPQPERKDPPKLPAPPPRTPRRAFRVFAATTVLLVVGIVASETFSYVASLIDRNFVAGVPLGILAAIAFASGAFAFGWELWAFRRQLRRLKEAASLREEAQRILAAPEETHRGRNLGARVVARYKDRPESTDEIARFKLTVTSAHSDGEVVSLLVQNVLRPLDSRAYRIVSRAACDAGVGVMLSPAGFLDTALVIWRTSRMIRDIALVYGYRPSRIGRLALTRRVLENAAMAGAAEYLGDLMTAHIGAGALGRVSNKFGQGAFTALRTARLGLIAIEACRPVPFTPDDRAGLASLRREILTQFSAPTA